MLAENWWNGPALVGQPSEIVSEFGGRPRLCRELGKIRCPLKAV
jgi:hypothetical protein